MTRPDSHHGQGRKPDSFHSSPAEAQTAPREEYLYVAAMRAGTGVDAPDFLAVVDTKPDSDTHGQIVHETPMPYVGDELHHFGWNRCSSACHEPVADARECMVATNRRPDPIQATAGQEPGPSTRSEARQDDRPPKRTDAPRSHKEAGRDQCR